MKNILAVLVVFATEIFKTEALSISKQDVPRIYSKTLCTNPPTSKNWVELNKVTPVQYQGNCDCCHIFAGIAALESAVAIKYGTSPVKLSEQNMLDCIKFPYPDDNICEGGYPEWVWEASKADGGVIPAASYNPYTAEIKTCNKNITKAPNTIVDYYIVNPRGDEESLKCALHIYGPHAINIDFSEPMKQYESGIFEDTTGSCDSTFLPNGYMKKPFNHGVTLVGYGSELNNAGVMTGYWLIKNSWGEEWGMNGFIKIARNKNNLCHVASDAAVPILMEVF